MAKDKYEEACERAAKEQGVDVVFERLSREGIPCLMAQTGGFVMVVHLPRPEGGYLGITDENEDPASPSYFVCHYADEEDEGRTVYLGLESLDALVTQLRAA